MAASSSPERMVTPGMMLARGLRARCPNCGGDSLFAGRFRIASQCGQCGMDLEREEGFYLGALPLSYGFTTFVGLGPVFIFWLLDWLGDYTAAVLALVLALALPILIWRHSRALWLAGYFAFLPGHLPANGGHLRAEEER